MVLGLCSNWTGTETCAIPITSRASASSQSLSNTHVGRDMKGFRDKEVHEDASRGEALREPIGTVVGVRWVDHKKGTCTQSEERSR